MNANLFDAFQAAPPETSPPLRSPRRGGRRTLAVAAGAVLALETVVTVSLGGSTKPVLLVAIALTAGSAFLLGVTARTDDDRQRRGRFIRSVLDDREVKGALPGLPSAEIMRLRRVTAGGAMAVGALVGLGSAATASRDTTSAWLFAWASIGLALAILHAASTTDSID